MICGAGEDIAAPPPAFNRRDHRAWYPCRTELLTRGDRIGPLHVWATGAPAFIVTMPVRYSVYVLMPPAQ